MRTSKWNLLGLGCVVLLVLAPSFSAFATMACSDFGLGADPCDPNAGYDVCEYYSANTVYRCLYFDSYGDTITAVSEDEGANGYPVMFGTTYYGDFCCDYTDFAGNEYAMHPLLINTYGGNDTIALVYDAVVIEYQWNDRSSLYAGAGNDNVTGSDWYDETSSYCRLDDGSGNPCDYIETGLGEDYVEAGDGDDEIVAPANDNYGDGLYGEEGDDKIFGGSQNDYAIDGGDGDDVLRGGDGADTINGGTGTDWINGNDGVDYVYGDYDANLALCGGAAVDYVDGGATTAVACADLADNFSGGCTPAVRVGVCPAAPF